jgi:hypothetical protein
LEAFVSRTSVFEAGRETVSAERDPPLTIGRAGKIPVMPIKVRDPNTGEPFDQDSPDGVRVRVGDLESFVNDLRDWREEVEDRLRVLERRALDQGG